MLFKTNRRRDKGWLERFVKDRAAELAVVHSSIPAEAFLRYCIDEAPMPDGQRDTRRQSFIRTMRRMEERGDLPFRVEGDTFVL